MGIEPATSSLGIKTTAPLFSQLTKSFKKNQRACNAYRACSAWFACRWGTVGGRCFSSGGTEYSSD